MFTAKTELIIILYIPACKRVYQRRTKMNHTITAQNIYQESFHNLCFLSDVTKYADPISAIKKLNIEWNVEKDHCGNIVKFN